MLLCFCVVCMQWNYLRRQLHPGILFCSLCETSDLVPLSGCRDGRINMSDTAAIRYDTSHVHMHATCSRKLCVSLHRNMPRAFTLLAAGGTYRLGS
jgi:hypothetical protein